jgi:hypothetical protein
MIDLETNLRDSLRDYAESITPTPADEFVPLVALAPATPVARGASGRQGWIMGACAAASVAVLVSALALLPRGTQSDPTAAAPITSPQPAHSGTWQHLDEAPLSPRKLPSVVWTGTEFIVWGGSDGAPHALADGAVYNPATETWRTIATTSAAHPGANAVWAADRMVVLAGADGAAYDPATDEWSSLPDLDLAGDEVGFTDAVLSDGVLLGVGVTIDDSGSRAELSVWTLDHDQNRWSEPQQITISSALPIGRLVSVADQFSVYSPIPTDDGFVLWNAHEGGWRYSTDDSWSRVPPVAPSPEAALLDSTATWWDGHLVAIVATTTADATSIGIAVLDDDGWSPIREVQPGTIGFPHAVTVDDGVVLLGTNGDQSADPLLIDPRNATATPLDGYPIHSAFEQGAAWSGSSLLVWGGQPSNNSGTAAQGSTEGATWVP